MSLFEQSKQMSYILRFGMFDEKSKFNILSNSISNDGYVPLDLLLTFLQNVTISDILQIVNSNDKQRFNIIQDEKNKYYIRANQGHSKNASKYIKDSELLVEITSPLITVFMGQHNKI